MLCKLVTSVRNNTKRYMGKNICGTTSAALQSDPLCCVTANKKNIARTYLKFFSRRFPVG